MRDLPEPAEQMPPSTAWWSSDFIEKLGSVSLVSQRETLITSEPDNYTEHDRLSSQTASQILWSTGMLSEPIPNGFYSVIPVSILFSYKFLAVENKNCVLMVFTAFMFCLIVAGI